MSKTYGQIAYEAGTAWIMTNREDRPQDGFEAWVALDDDERAYWEEIGRVVSKTAYEQHLSALPVLDIDECGTCGEIGAHRTGCPNRGGP